MVVEVKDNLPKKTFRKVQGEVLQVSKARQTNDTYKRGMLGHAKSTFASSEPTLPPDFRIIMKRTINFCGDSFCAWIGSAKTPSWGDHLIKDLNLKLIGMGKASTAYEYAIKSFNPNADITVFCWTSAKRLYHKDYISNYQTGVLKLPSYKRSEILSITAEIFYREFYSKQYFNTLQMRSLYWFDKEVLSQYKGLAIHLFCFEKTYHFENGINVDHILHSTANYEKSYPSHFDEKTNKWFADKIFNVISEYES